MKTIYLTGYKKQNLGDDLFFLSVLNRYDNTLFLFEDTQSGYYSELFKEFDNIRVLPYIRINIFRRALNKIKRIANSDFGEQFYTTYQKKHRIKADAYLKIGGSIFIEPNKDLGIISKRFIAEKNYFKNVPFFYIGCNFGPYTSPVFLRSAEYVIKNCNGICFRDSYSFNLFKHFEHVRLAPDVLFGIRRICQCSSKRTKSLGLSLINFSRRPSLAKYYNSYLESVCSFIEMHNNKYELIRLFSFCEPEGDGQAIRDLIALLPEEYIKKIEVVTYNGNYKDFLMKVSEVDLLLSTRFHAMILGLVYGIKTVPIVYSNKISNVLNDLNCEVPTVCLESISKNSLTEAALRSKVVNVDAQIHNCDNQFNDFDNFVKS